MTDIQQWSEENYSSSRGAASLTTRAVWVLVTLVLIGILTVLYSLSYEYMSGRAVKQTYHAPKDPSQDPCAQGNALDGCGPNCPTEELGPPSPKPTFPTSPYTAPPPPSSRTSHKVRMVIGAQSSISSPEGGYNDCNQDNPPGDPGPF